MYEISSYTQNKLVSDCSLAGRKSVSLKWAGTDAVCFALLWCEIVLPLGKLGIDLLRFFLFPLLFFLPFSSSVLVLVSLCFLSSSLLSWRGLILPHSHALGSLSMAQLFSVWHHFLCWVGKGSGGHSFTLLPQIWHPLWSFLDISSCLG